MPGSAFLQRLQLDAQAIRMWAAVRRISIFFPVDGNLEEMITELSATISIRSIVTTCADLARFFKINNLAATDIWSVWKRLIQLDQAYRLRVAVEKILNSDRNGWKTCHPAQFTWWNVGRTLQKVVEKYTRRSANAQNISKMILLKKFVLARMMIQRYT